jgi:uncharacterized protein
VTHRDSLIEIVRATPWLMRALRAVRSVAPPGACVGAGAVRSTVWDVLHGHPKSSPLADVDVAYFDPTDMSPESEAQCQRYLTELEPDLVWDVANQAAVHLWYARRFGEAAAPLDSLEDAVRSWPETATAVAVRLDGDDTLHVVAPCGLADLFACVVRRNPVRVSASQFRARVQAKRYAERWPRVRVVWE